MQEVEANCSTQVRFLGDSTDGIQRGLGSDEAVVRYVRCEPSRLLSWENLSISKSASGRYFSLELKITNLFRPDGKMRGLINHGLLPSFLQIHFRSVIAFEKQLLILSVVSKSHSTVEVRSCSWCLSPVNR